MTQILSRLAAIVMTLLLAAYSVGWWSWAVRGRVTPEGSSYMLHLYLGLTAVTACLGIHCLVFIYFLGTGRWVKEVALAYRIPDQPLPRLTRELKRKAFPPALLAMLVPIAAAAAGAAVATVQGVHWLWHASLATLSLAVNAWAFVIELRCVDANSEVITQVMAEVDRIRAEKGLPSNAEELRRRKEQEDGAEAPAGRV
jgi:hypothetical protein